MQNSHPHFTKIPLSRRQFLKTMAALPWLISQTGNRSFSTGQPLSSAPFWWAHLPSGKLYTNSKSPPPSGRPGSLNKLILTAALLEENLLSPMVTFPCHGEQIIDGLAYRCQKPHGRLTLEEALGFSCNLYFAQATDKLSPETFLHYCRRFLLDQRVCQSDPVHFPATTRQALTEGPPLALFLGLSSSIQPSLLQILRMTSILALRGEVPAFESPGLSGRGHPTPLPRLRLAGRTWDLLQKGMVLAARSGTAQALDPAHRLHLAVKTGTTPNSNGFDSWITGYFPYESPQYAFALRALNGTSIDKAVPLARQALFSRPWP